MKTSKLGVRLFTCLLAVVLLAGMAAACTTEVTPEPTPAPAPAPAPAPSPAPAPAPAPDEVITLKVHSGYPPMIPPSQPLIQVTDKIKEESGGRVDFDIYWSSSLIKSHETMEATGAGIVDIAQMATGDYPSLFLLGPWVTLPFLGYPSPENTHLVYMEMMDKYPQIEAEYQGLKVLYPLCAGEGANYIHTTSTPITTVEGMKGKKFLGMLPMHARIIENVGGTAVNMAPEDIYVSLERGLIEANMGGLSLAVGMGFLELLKYHTVVPEQLDIMYTNMIMNPESFSSLPPDIQKIFDDLEEWFVKSRQEAEIQTGVMARTQAEEMGHEFIELEPGEVDKIMEAALPLHEEWIEEREAMGLPARALIEDVKARFAELR
jgi:TRAP-type C4-dicarboxylate transport system substrate-binding protein